MVVDAGVAKLSAHLWVVSIEPVWKLGYAALITAQDLEEVAWWSLPLPLVGFVLAAGELLPEVPVGLRFEGLVVLVLALLVVTLRLRVGLEAHQPRQETWALLAVYLVVAEPRESVVPVLAVVPIAFVRGEAPEERAPRELHDEGEQRRPEQLLGQAAGLVVVLPVVRTLRELLEDALWRATPTPL